MTKLITKQNRIDIIVDLLEKSTKRIDIVQKLTKAYKVSDATIDKEIKQAKKIISKRNDEREAIRLSTTSNEYKEALNEAIVSDIELEFILCKIATAGYKVEEFIKGEPIIREITPSEQISAIDKIFKKRGSNAPTKTENKTENTGAIRVIRE